MTPMYIPQAPRNTCCLCRTSVRCTLQPFHRASVPTGQRRQELEEFLPTDTPYWQVPRPERRFLACREGRSSRDDGSAVECRPTVPGGKTMPVIRHGHRALQDVVGKGPTAAVTDQLGREGRHRQTTCDPVAVKAPSGHGKRKWSEVLHNSIGANRPGGTRGCNGFGYERQDE